MLPGDPVVTSGTQLAHIGVLSVVCITARDSGLLDKVQVRQFCTLLKYALKKLRFSSL
jgi:hypothetical protein